MIPKSMSSTPIGDGNRFSDKIMGKQKPMIPKSGNRFPDKIMGKQ